ncbi:MAG TPA: helix-turn-helix domain-containing protein, partial [Dehalococcoidia bacterium]|nr:helix-turn-helix domain-containing protein [Dehalococcoidia bacterium]
TALVEDLSFRSVTSRVAKILLQQGREASLQITQQELAAMAGTAREVVGRALKALEERGAIRLERGRILVLDRRALAEAI